MLKLDFTYADLNLPATLSVTRRQSISGVQQKTQLLRQRGRFVPVESGGDYILKPAPRNTPARLAADIPANEALTMDIAHDIFKINVAEHELVQLADGELAYLTKRFDSRNGVKLHQEDFCQLSNRSPATHGTDYKYDGSYEELAELIRRFCPSATIECPKVFFIILFNYVFANGDAHLKNFSLYESPQGDYILTPAYDLLNTSVHFPNEPTATGLDFFADGHFTSRYEELGFYSSADFVELGLCYDIGEYDVRELLSSFIQNQHQVTDTIESSYLSPEAKELYLGKFLDRLRAIKQ